MMKYLLNRAGRVALVNEIIAAYERGEDMETALLEIREREQNFTPSLSARTGEWKEGMNNFPVFLAQSLIDSGELMEVTTPIPGDAVEFDGVTPNLTGVVTDYRKDGRLIIRMDNGEIVSRPYNVDSYTETGEKEDEYDEIPCGTRNFWMLNDSNDIKWARKHFVTLSAIGFKVWQGTGTEGDDVVCICTGDSNENAMFEQLFKERFNVRG